jgi:hypothetical protein
MIEICSKSIYNVFNDFKQNHENYISTSINKNLGLLNALAYKQVNNYK